MIPKSVTDFIGNPVAWLLITIVAVIIGAIFIPGPGDVPEQEIVKRITSTEFESNIKNIDDIVKEDNMSITKDDDASRFEAFLQVEETDNRTRPLFDTAEKHIDNDELVGLDGNNAWQVYQEILAIDPQNTEAQSGASKILNYFIDHAEMAIEAEQYDDAETWLQKLDLAQPGDELQKMFRAEISDELARKKEEKRQQEEAAKRKKQIADLIKSAREESEPFTFDFDKVRDIYENVLEIDSENLEAKQGLLALANKQLDNAEILIRANVLDRASNLIKAAKENDPDNTRLSGIDLALDVKKKQYEQEKIIAQQKAENEQRIAEIKAEAKAEEERRIKLEKEAALAAEKAAQEAKRLAEQQALAAQQAQVAKEQAAKEQAAKSTATDKAPTDTGADTNTANSTSSAEPDSQPQQTSTDGSQTTNLLPETQKARDQLKNGINAYYRGNYPSAFEYLFPLAEVGHARAQFRIGIMYQFGRSVSIDKTTAGKWFQLALPAVISAAQNGVSWAQADLGTAYEFGISLQQDLIRAAHWYEQAAQQGYAGAQTNLGVLYANGEGVKKDTKKAAYWLSLAANQGDTIAAQNLKILGLKINVDPSVIKETNAQSTSLAPTNDK